MSSNDTKKILANLTREESFVLYRKLEKDTHRAISQKMEVSIQTVQIYSSSLYEKFGLAGGNWDSLRDATNLIMRRVVRPADWKHWQWPPIELLEEIEKAESEEGKRVYEESKASVDKPDEEKKDIQPKSPNAEPEPVTNKNPSLPQDWVVASEEPQQSKTWLERIEEFVESIASDRRYQFLAFFLVIAIVCICGLSLVWGSLNFINPNPTEVAQRPSSTNTFNSPSETPTPLPSPTMLPSPTSTIIVKPEPTSTRPQTRTPLPTATQTMTPTPTQTLTATFTPPPPNTILFSDDFDNGLNETWYIPGVYPPIAQGQLVANEPTLILVDHTLWENIQISVDVEPKSKTGAGPEGRFSIIARYFDEENMIALTFNGYSNVWYEKTNGEWNMVPNTSVKGPKFQEWNRVVITIEGAKFYASINGEIKNDFISSRNDPGQTGLMLHPNAYVDNYVISSLP